MELWQALAITEYRYYHPSADTLVAGYLGYKPARAVNAPQLSEAEKAEWRSLGITASPHAAPLKHVPKVLKERFPFLATT